MNNNLENQIRQFLSENFGGMGGGMPPMPQMGGMGRPPMPQQRRRPMGMMGQPAMPPMGGGMDPFNGMGGEMTQMGGPMGGGSPQPQQPPPAMGQNFNFQVPQQQGQQQGQQPKRPVPTMFGDMMNPVDDARNQALAQTAMQGQQQQQQQQQQQGMGQPSMGGMPQMGQEQQDPYSQMMSGFGGGMPPMPQMGGMGMGRPPMPPMPRRRPQMGGSTNPFSARPPMGPMGGR